MQQSKNNCSVFLRVMPDGKYSTSAKGHWRITYPAFFRFDIPFYFNDVDKVIYLDSDILVRKDISELYNIDIEGYYCGCVIDGGIINAQISFENLKGVKLNDYFNSGVIVFNCKKIRNDNKKDDFKRLLGINEIKQFRYLDQDIINICFNGFIKKIPPKYNFVINSYYGGMIANYELTKWSKKSGYSKDEWEEARQDPTCVHFTRPKPFYFLKENEANDEICRFTNYMNNLSVNVDYKTLYNLEGVDDLVSFENKLKGLLGKYYNEYTLIKGKLIQNKILNAELGK